MNPLFKKIKNLVETSQKDDELTAIQQQAQDPTTSPEILHNITKTHVSNPEIMKHIVKNPNAALHTRVTALHKYASLAPDFFENPALELDGIETDPFQKFDSTANIGLQTFAASPMTNEFWQNKLFSRPDNENIHKGLSENPNLHPDIADKIYHNQYPFQPQKYRDTIHRNILENPALPNRDIRKTLHDQIADFISSEGYYSPDILYKNDPDVHHLLNNEEDFETIVNTAYRREDGGAEIFSALLNNPGLSANNLNHLARSRNFKNLALKNKDSDYLYRDLIKHPNLHPDSIYNLLDRIQYSQPSDKILIHNLLLQSRPDLEKRFLNNILDSYRYPRLRIPKSILANLEKQKNWNEDYKKIIRYEAE